MMDDEEPEMNPSHVKLIHLWQSVQCSITDSATDESKRSAGSRSDFVNRSWAYWVINEKIKGRILFITHNILHIIKSNEQVLMFEKSNFIPSKLQNFLFHLWVGIGNEFLLLLLGLKDPHTEANILRYPEFPGVYPRIPPKKIPPQKFPPVCT